MAFELDNTKIKCSVYHMNCSLMYNDILYEVDDNAIGDCGIIYNFRDNLFPILHLKIFLPHKQAYEVREYTNTLLIRIKITSAKALLTDITNPDQVDDKANELNSGIIFDEIFQPLNLDRNYFSQYNKESKIVDKLGSSNDSDYSNPVELEEMELYLFSVTGLNNNKTIINRIFGNATIDEALIYIFNLCGIENVIMSRPTNETRYTDEDHNQIILPPLNFKNTIDHLQANYGIYDLGFVQFFDFNTYYLIDKDYRHQIPLGRYEYDTVYIYIHDYDTNIINRDGCYDDPDNQCYVISCYDNTNIQNDADAIKETVGDEFRIMTEDTINNSVSYDEETGKFTFYKPYQTYSIDHGSNINSDKKVVMLYSDVENPTTWETMLNNAIENRNGITLNFMNVDISFFKLNRKYVIMYENRDKSINDGVYRITQFGYGMNQREFYIIGEFKKIIDI